MVIFAKITNKAKRTMQKHTENKTMQWVLTLFRENLPDLQQSNETESVLRLITESVFGRSLMLCQLEPNRLLTEQEVLKIEHFYERLFNNEPIQYILGEAHFYDLVLSVNPSVLIPRQETEELVHWIISDYAKGNQPISILDLGTGSGCIPIALKQNLPKADVFACDISDEALATARFNARKNKAEVHFFKSDILNNPQVEKEGFDIIVSNPPYVTRNEKSEMHAKVVSHEPHLALFVSNNDPLLFYRALAQIGLKYLNKEGSLYLEINQYLAKETCVLLAEMGYVTQLRNDLNNNARMIKAWLPK